MESRVVEEALVGRCLTKTHNWTAKSAYQACQTWRTCSTVTKREALKMKVVIKKAVSRSVKLKFHSRASRA